MADTERLILSLIEDIYAAAVEPERWERVLDNLCAITGGAKGCMTDMTVDDAPRQKVTVSRHFGDQYIDDYNTYYDKINPILPFFLRPQVGKVYASEFLISVAEMRKTEYYDGWMKPQHIDRGCFSFLQREERNVLVLSFFHGDRPERERKLQETVVQALVPHIQRAISVSRKLAEGALQGDLADAFLSRIGGGAIVVAPGGSIGRMNQEAERIVRANDGLAVRGGRLVATAPHVQAQFARLIAQVEQIARGAGIASDGVMAIERPSGLPSYGVLVCPILTRAQVLPDAGHILVIITDVTKSLPTPIDLMRKLHNLTAAEARLAVAIVNGATLAKAADQFGVSFNTVHTQLQAIFSKVGVRRQADLVRLLTMQMAAAGPKDRGTDIIPS